ncbi:MAG: Nif3-like dinuclear metal center hexameric protein [Desulfarculaceae bacterium]|nr:Nif3-like dinuclear metal center hexameric protein [Desulfarculaceae bacterium]MCF8073956.1 Nif3-like dinuclear metal center hexameric protein [Desulfarculaceae bacterium]MCF8102642.1 Nif3-like dinuclear metal center hexameric protein [Desulfarculaceae bacterium]MCF8117589.1 Nif3-like dinuclear metal center hexameric protein [Desulfarculaceae bacterium]
MSAQNAQATVGQIMQVMEQWAPAAAAEEWDQVGLQVGDPSAPAGKAWTALELDDACLEAALTAGVQMLLVHHPPLFKPLSSLRGDRPETARLIKAATAEMAIFAAHTNLDSAPGGVNDVLGRRLGLGELTPLTPGRNGGLVKLVVFTPPEALDQVSAALFAAGAGRIGGYSECSFAAVGVGSFRAPSDGHPYLGNPGEKELVEELRLEVHTTATAAPRVLAALKQAHPYEEPAVDVYPLTQSPPGFGLGRVGELPAPVEARHFARRAAAELKAGWAHLGGAPPKRISRVAVVGGSGGDMLPAAAASGAHLLITGEASHHAAQQAADLGLGILCLGHYQTEVVIVEPWAARLGRELTALGLDCTIEPYTGGVDPWHPVAHKEE